MTSEIDEALVHSLILEIPQTTDRKLLYAGLAVLCRDIFYYLQDNPRDDSSWFDDVIDQITAEEMATFGDGAFPYYDAHDTDQLPSGLAAAAAAGRFTFAPLLDRAIEHEWTSHPGELLQRRFLVRLGSKLEQACGAGGPYESAQKGDVGLYYTGSGARSNFHCKDHFPRVYWNGRRQNKAPGAQRRFIRFANANERSWFHRRN